MAAWPHLGCRAADMVCGAGGRAPRGRGVQAGRSVWMVSGWGVGGWSMDDFSIGTMAGAPVVVNGERAG